MTRLFFPLVFAILLTASCSDEVREVTIFSIPTNASPSSLRENGFEMSRFEENFFDSSLHPENGMENGYLDLVYAQVKVWYDAGDTTKIRRYSINIDFKPFEKMTGLKAQEYASVDIEGYPYKVKVNEDNMSLYLTRLGL